MLLLFIRTFFVWENGIVLHNIKGPNPILLLHDHLSK